ncbi:MAG: hypothetical protein ACK2UQ_19010, partial [Anaerolineae bacterium]
SLSLLPLSALLLLTFGCQAVTGSTSASAAVVQPAAAPTVTLWAVSGATIPFTTQNGQTLDGVLSQSMELPHLVLYCNGTLSNPAERTLVIQVNGIAVPPVGVTVTLELATQDGDNDPVDRQDQRIVVWRESQWVANTTGATTTGVAIVFTHEFAASVTSGAGTIAMPTDYFQYDITVTDASRPADDPLQTFSADYALLMESQWVERLPEVQEEHAGAAPDELVVYYCDMFPFRKSSHDPATWLPRKDIADYVGMGLVPQMVEAYRIQTDVWGFPWYDAWISYRPDEPERLTVALSDGQTWFHSWAPARGHSGISIRVNGGDNAAYDTLTDGLMSSFHHELFHNVQRNILLHSNGNGNASGLDDAWRFFSEGTAVLASSVGQSRGQSSYTVWLHDYLFCANSFILFGGGRSRDLNTSYSEIDPYRAVLYWRFLYEQCGGLANGAEDPSTGMRVIGDALRALYSGDIVDIASSVDLVGAMPKIMDRALVGSSCPFQTYEESLTAFADAIFGLRLDRGRCLEPGIPGGCGFYDPYSQYQDPPVSTIAFTGADTTYRDGVGSSFGIDLIEVALDRAIDGQPLTIEFYRASTSDAVFSVQLWPLKSSEEGAKPRRVLAELASAQILQRSDTEGHLTFVIPAIQWVAYDRLGLIITRVDAKETSDPVGEYTVELHSGIE